MISIEPGKTYLRRVQLKTRAKDALPERQRVEQALSRTDLRPAWLSPGAIFCVRRLAYSLPAEPRWLPAWERAIQARLSELVRRAACPARQAVPDGAEAVVFADRAELLACLASDWLEGRIGQNWWWQALFPGAQLDQALIAAFNESPEYLPAALELLAGQGKAASVAKKLDAAAARRLWQTMLFSFNLLELSNILLESLANEPNAPSFLPITSPLSDFRGVSRPETSLPVQTLPRMGGGVGRYPWQTWVPESSTPGLEIDQAIFLGMGLALWRRPSLVRSLDFTREIRTAFWPENHWQAEDYPTRRDNRPDIQEISPVDDVRPGTTSSSPIPPALGQLARLGSLEAFPGSQQPTNQQHPAQASVVMPAAPDSMGTIPSVSDLGFSTPETARQPEPGALVIYTRFGGLFYLLNLGLFLGLYSDFASPGNQDISLSAWDLLAIAGWAWIGPDLQADPLWPLLGSLAGRQPDTPIGAGFEPPTSWKAPSRWMEPFTSQFCDSSTSDGRLRVRHPAGFLLLDIPFDPVISFQEQLDLALADYRSWLSGAPVAAAAFSYSPPEMHALESLGLSAPLRRWAAWLLNYSACRLNLALGLKDASTLPSFILAYSARIELTPVHLDITYSLADLPVEIRLAGLDRDPWWMPAAGRFISFHYE